MVIWEHNEEKGMFRIILYNDPPFHPPGFSVETVKSKEQLVSFMLDVIDIYQLKAPPKRMLDILQTYTEKQMPYRPYLQYSRYRSLMGSDNVEQLFEQTAMALQSTVKEARDESSCALFQTIEKDFPIWKSQEALSLATQSSLFRDMMKFNRFPELPVEMKLQIIKKVWAPSFFSHAANNFP